MRITPKETHLPIVLNLANVLVPLIADEKVLKQWMKYASFPQEAIDGASGEFKQILKKKGLLDIQNFDGETNRQAAIKQATSQVQENFVEIMQRHIRLALYGKGNLSDLFKLNETGMKCEYYLRAYMTIAQGYN